MQIPPKGEGLSPAPMENETINNYYNTTNDTTTNEYNNSTQNNYNAGDHTLTINAPTLDITIGNITIGQTGGCGTGGTGEPIITTINNIAVTDINQLNVITQQTVNNITNETNSVVSVNVGPVVTTVTDTLNQIINEGGTGGGSGGGGQDGLLTIAGNTLNLLRGDTFNILSGNSLSVVAGSAQTIIGDITQSVNNTVDVAGGTINNAVNSLANTVDTIAVGLGNIPHSPSLLSANLSVLDHTLSLPAGSGGSFIDVNAAFLNQYTAIAPNVGVIDADAALLSPAPDGAVRIDQVRFGYGDLAVIDNAHITIAPGDTVAITGPQGSGKTTLLELMAGLYAPDRGQILLSGMEVSRLPAEERSRYVGYLTMRGMILRGSIMDNLTGFDPRHRAEARNVADQLGIEEAVSLLPSGYDTPLEGISTDVIAPGLKQRISMARALLFKPRLILFDNADHGMDRESYSRIFDLLARLKGKATLVLVSDDKNILSLADHVIELRRGHLVPLMGPNPLIAGAGRRMAAGAS